MSTAEYFAAPTRRTSLMGPIRAEAIKALSVRSTWALLIINVVGGLATSFAVGTFVTDEVLIVAEVGFYWVVVAAVLAAIGGILIFTAEAQHGTLTPTLAARPARIDLAVAKAVIASLLGVAFGATGLLAGFGGAAASGIDIGNRSDLPATAAWALLYVSLSALFGLGLGMIVRHGAGAIAGLLVWGFIIENLFLGFLPADAARFLPFFAGNHLLELDSDIDSVEAIAVALSRIQNGAVFTVYVLLVLGSGVAILRRCDIE